MKCLLDKNLLIEYAHCSNIAYREDAYHAVIAGEAANVLWKYLSALLTLDAKLKTLAKKAGIDVVS